MIRCDRVRGMWKICNMTRRSPPLAMPIGPCSVSDSGAGDNLQFELDMLLNSDVVINELCPERRPRVQIGLFKGAPANGSAMRQPPKDGAALPEVNSSQLAAVRAVAEYRSFIAAAYLGISQPALTLTIKRLEQTLGLPLFLRT